MDEKSKEFVADKSWEKSQIVKFVIAAAVTVGYIVVALCLFAPVAIVGIFGLLTLYYMFNIFKAEYSYTISNKLTVEILGKGGKRKNVAVFSMSDMIHCAPANRADQKSRIEEADEVIDASTDKNDEKTYFALFERENKKTALLFTPTEMMLNELDKHTSHKSVR